MRHGLISFLDRFRRSEDGIISIELALMTPILVWCTVATIGFFDGYRARFSTEKATTTVADLISRETITLGDEYMDGLFDLLTALAYRNDDIGMRVTVVRFDEGDEEEGDEELVIVWSEVRGTILDPITDSNFIDVQSKFPIMGDEQRFILVESFAGYTKRFNTIFASAVEDFDIYVDAAISPRFVEKVCFQANSGSPLYC